MPQEIVDTEDGYEDIPVETEEFLRALDAVDPESVEIYAGMEDDVVGITFGDRGFAIQPEETALIALLHRKFPSKFSARRKNHAL